MVRRGGLPRAVLLDLDDTILDDTGGAPQSWREACWEHADLLDGLPPGELLEAIDAVRHWYWGDADRHRVGRLDLDAATREVVRMALARLGADLPEATVRIARDYRARRDALLRPLGDAVETVEWLRGSGCRLALLTNGAATPQRRKVERFDLARLFDLILIEGEVGYGKPDPRIYEIALDGLSTAPEDAWMVGDNLEWDVAQPQRMGLLGIWIDRMGRGVPSGRNVRPDRVIGRLAELRTELKLAEPGAGP